MMPLASYLYVFAVGLALSVAGCPRNTRWPCRCYLGILRCPTSSLSEVPAFLSLYDPQPHFFHAIDFSGHNFTAIRENTFVHIRARHVILDDNPIRVEQIAPDAFATIGKDLTHLSLAGCQLTRVEAFLFFGMSTLQSLNLQRNFISAVFSGVLSGLVRLKSLDLWQNRIDLLSDRAFVGLTHLRHLDLDSNHLTRLSTQKLAGLVRLRSLTVARNRLTSLSNATFNEMPRLRQLDLRHNRLQYLSERTFTGLSQLLTLRLEHNRLTYLQNGLFRPLVRLITLKLGHNRISGLVWQRTFSGLYSLQSIDLRSNGMTELRASVFENSPLLQFVFLDGNNLTTVRRCFWNWRARLKLVSLVSNPLSCDCRLAWITDLHRMGVRVWGSCEGPASEVRPLVDSKNYAQANCPICLADCRRRQRCPSVRSKVV